MTAISELQDLVKIQDEESRDIAFARWIRVWVRQEVAYSEFDERLARVLVEAPKQRMMDDLREAQYLAQEISKHDRVLEYVELEDQGLRNIADPQSVSFAPKEGDARPRVEILPLSHRAYRTRLCLTVLRARPLP